MVESEGSHWWQAVDSREAQFVLKKFRELLRDMPLTHAELADRIGVDVSTVNRWSSESTKPSLSKMESSVEKVLDHLEDLGRDAQQVQSAVSLVQEAVAAKPDAASAVSGDWEHYDRAVDELRKRREDEEDRRE